MKTKKHGVLNIARSMLGGAGLALAEYRAAAQGCRLNIPLVVESTRATFLIALAVPVLILAIASAIAFISVQSMSRPAVFETPVALNDCQGSHIEGQDSPCADRSR